MAVIEQRAPERRDQPAQVLFEEARQRRRKRWLVTGLITLVIVATAVWAVADAVGQAGRNRTGTARLRPRLPVSAPAPGSATFTATLRGPEALAVASNGGVLIDDQASNQIVEREPDGSFRVIAGDGRAGSAGDGGPATDAQLDLPVAVAVGSHGAIYVADEADNRIQVIRHDGRISTLARVSEPSALAVGPNGLLYVVDSVGIQTVSIDGATATLMAPSVSSARGAAGGLSVAGTAFDFNPDAIAVSASGDVYVANFSPKTIIRFSPTGTTPIPVGGANALMGQTYVTRAGLVAAPNGTVVVADYGRFAVDRATGAGLTVVKTFALGSVPGVRGVFRPSGVAVAPDGEIYTDTDGRNGGTFGPALLAIDPDGVTHLLATGPPTPNPGS